VLGYDGADPYLVVDAAAIDDAGGNANGRLDPGETADAIFTLVNIGGVDASNVTATLSTDDPYLTITDNSGYFGAMPIDMLVDNMSDPFTITASGSAPHGYNAEFTLIATGDGGFADTIVHELTIGQPVPTDSGHYYAYYSGGLHEHAPTYFWVAIDSTQSTYPGVSLDFYDNQSAYLPLPFPFTYYGVEYDSFTICSNGWIAMGHRVTTDWTNSGIPNTDGPEAMIAPMWDDLDPGNTGQPSDVYYYYDQTNHRLIVEYFQVEHYAAGYHETFEVILYDPAYYPTPTGDGEILFQYLLAQQQVDNTIGIENADEDLGIQYSRDNVYHENAMTITDEFAIRITTWKPDQTGIEEFNGPVDAVSSILSVSPSITTGSVQIAYTLIGHSGEKTVYIYDATGRRVRRYLCDGEQATVTWDGRDAAGNRVASGIYFVTMDSGDVRESRKVIVVD
jgi:hypothetical protein